MRKIFRSLGFVSIVLLALYNMVFWTHFFLGISQGTLLSDASGENIASAELIITPCNLDNSCK